MAVLRLAGNLIPVTEGRMNWGHLQIVYVDGESQQEIEVQRGLTWQYPDVRDHRLHTPYFGDTTNYDFVNIDLGDRSAEAVWRLLIDVHEQFAQEGTDIRYNFEKNSNSYANTLLDIIGIDVRDILIDARPASVEAFPGVLANALLIRGDSIPLVLSGSAENDIIRTGLSSDEISGGAGNDTLVARDGNDRISGGRDHDVLEGGPGSDTYIYTIGDGHDTIVENGRGRDTIEIRDDIVPTIAGDISFSLVREVGLPQELDLRISFGAQGEVSEGSIVIADFNRQYIDETGRLGENAVETLRIVDASGRLVTRVNLLRAFREALEAETEPAPNAPPTISGPESVRLETGQTIDLGALFADVRDPDGQDDIAFVRFWDSTPETGYITNNGVRSSEGYVDATLAEIASGAISYVAGEHEGTNRIVVEAFDRRGGDSQDLLVTITVTSPPEPTEPDPPPPEPEPTPQPEPEPTPPSQDVTIGWAGDLVITLDEGDGASLRVDFGDDLPNNTAVRVRRLDGPSEGNLTEADFDRGWENELIRKQEISPRRHIELAQDDLVEPVEDIRFELYSPTNGAIIDPERSIVRVIVRDTTQPPPPITPVEPDPVPAASDWIGFEDGDLYIEDGILHADVVEGDTLRLRVDAGDSVPQLTRVRYITEDTGTNEANRFDFEGDAEPIGNFQLSDQHFGNNYNQVIVRTQDDDEVEGVEEIDLVLFRPSDGAIHPDLGRVRLRIIDNDEEAIPDPVDEPTRINGTAGRDELTVLRDSIVRAGDGNDDITVDSLADLMTADVDGGEGYDTLIIGGNNQRIDVADLPITGFERIHLAGSGNTIEISYDDILDQTNHPDFAIDFAWDDRIRREAGSATGTREEVIDGMVALTFLGEPEVTLLHNPEATVV